MPHLDCQDFEAKIKNHDSSILISSSSVEPSKGLLMEELKQVLAAKYEFKNADLQLIITFLASSACQDSDAQEKMQRFGKAPSASENLLIETHEGR